MIVTQKGGRPGQTPPKVQLLFIIFDLMETRRTDSRCRNFMFVIYNWNPTDLDFIKSTVPNFLKYVIVGEELCPTTGTPHLQGYCMAKNKHSINSFKTGLDHLGMHTHWAIKPSRDQNHRAMIDYCKGLTAEKQNGKPKEEWEPQPHHQFGDLPKGQGTRTDLQAAIDVVTNGGSLYDVAVQCPEQFIKYSGGLSKWQAMMQPQRNWPMVVYWLWGKTGTGKSRWAFENTENPYYKDPNTRWWCGYAGQTEVIIDDFRPSKEMPFNYMLALLDRYPMQVQSKHGNHQFVSKKIFITCPNDIDTTLMDLTWLGTEAKEQFKRRVTHQIHFQAGNIVPHLTIESTNCLHIQNQMDYTEELPSNGPSTQDMSPVQRASQTLERTDTIVHHSTSNPLRTLLSTGRKRARVVSSQESESLSLLLTQDDSTESS